MVSTAGGTLPLHTDTEGSPLKYATPSMPGTVQTDSLLPQGDYDTGPTCSETMGVGRKQVMMT